MNYIRVCALLGLLCFSVPNLKAQGQDKNMPSEQAAEQEPVEKDILTRRIEAANHRFLKSLGKAAVANMLKLYTEDAIIMPPNSEALSRAEDLEAFKDWLMSPPPHLSLQTLEVEGHGDDTAIEMGLYTIRSADKAQILDEGKYIVVWKRRGGIWKFHRDIFNSNMPLSPSN